MIKKSATLALTLLTALTLALTSCHGRQQGSEATPSSQQHDAEMPDEAINRALRFYAGISKDGLNISEADAKAWNAYSATVGSFIDRSMPTRKMVESIAATDFRDFRDSVDFVFYPFSGPDFIYPFTLFPDADTYFLCGLENAGAPIDKDVVTAFSQYDIYRQALASYFRTSYFASKDMSSDYSTADIDGVCPVISMLMAISQCEVVSIKFKDIDDEGNIVNTADKRKMLEIRFVRKDSKHVQALYYYSSNLNDTDFDPHLQKFLAANLPRHTVGTYIKAAAFLMHFDHFSTIRSCILDHSRYLVQDDSGIPYRYVAERFNTTLYGEYVDPTKDFSEKCHQPDLQQLYTANAASIRPLSSRIGYNSPSNWMACRRKQ